MKDGERHDSENYFDELGWDERAWRTAVSQALGAYNSIIEVRMGCDIHGWLETKVDGKWVAVKEIADRKRNYARFAALAGVRAYPGDTGLPRGTVKGIPEDISETVKFWIEESDGDAHSHSWMEALEAFEIFRKTAVFGTTLDVDEPNIERFYDTSDAFGMEIYNSEEEFRIVFWFDN